VRVRRKLAWVQPSERRAINTSLGRTGEGPEERGKPLWLIYANCQAAAFAALLPRIQKLSEQLCVRYIFSHLLEEPGHGWETYPATYMDGVTCVWEQVSEAFPRVREEFHRRLPKGIRRVRFPAFSAGMLWPFAGPDPRPSRRRLYLYGDSVAARLGMQLAGKQVTDDEIFSRYMDMSHKRMPDLDRLLELEVALWQKRDRESDISVASYLLENYQSIQLFYERARITQHPLIHITMKLLDETMDGGISNKAEILEDVALQLRYHRGVDTFSQPIHPSVADKFQLKWYDPDATYSWFMHDWIFREWVVRCVRLAPYVSTHF
jgi:hypothetical protein